MLEEMLTRQLFAEERRAYSQGCIRVADAMGFAATLLGVERAALDAEAADGRTRTVPLSVPVPVHIGHFTAVTDADAGMRYRDYIYRRDSDRAASAVGVGDYGNSPADRVEELFGKFDNFEFIAHRKPLQETRINVTGGLAGRDNYPSR